MVLMMIFMCQLGTSGPNDARDLKKSMDPFLVSTDLHALGSSALGKGQGGCHGRREGQKMEQVTQSGNGLRTLPWACWGALLVTAKNSSCILNTYSIYKPYTYILSSPQEETLTLLFDG